MATTTPVFLDAAAVQTHLTFPSLLDHLTTTLPATATNISAPPRHHHSLSPAAASSSLLLMPSWSNSPFALPYLGVKLVTSFPSNSQRGLPGVHALYSLFDSLTGAPLATIDASPLTHIRTAAVSALASRFLARDDSQVLVVAGAGSLAPYLIRAHLLVKPSLNKVLIWNRTAEKARGLAARLEAEDESGVVFDHVERMEEAVAVGDVVSCATSSTEPIVRGMELKRGAHLDLVGSFSPGMRECDDDAVARGRVFVDWEGAVAEAGELVGAFERGVIAVGDVEGTLVDLVAGRKEGRRGPEEVTVFKSVGSAAVDLLAAQLVYENYRKASGQEN